MTATCIQYISASFVNSLPHGKQVLCVDRIVLHILISSTESSATFRPMNIGVGSKHRNRNILF